MLLAALFTAHSLDRLLHGPHLNRKSDEHGAGYQTLPVNRSADDCSLTPLTSSFSVIMECLVAIAFVVLGNG